MASYVRKQASLIKSVFSGNKGKELLELLKDSNAVAFTANSNEQYYRIGRSELVRELEYLLNITDEELKALEEPESYGPYDEF